jgi:signal transduction histidine kinase
MSAAVPTRAPAGLAPPEGDSWRHAVQFVVRGVFPAARVAGFLAEPLSAGGSAVAIVTGPHLQEIEREWRLSGLDAEQAVAEGRLVILDAEATLTALAPDGWPDRELFEASVGALVGRLSAGGRAVHAYGEMVDVLSGRGQREAALALEDLWDDLLERLRLRLLCGYTIEAFEGEGSLEGFHRVCSSHGFVWPARGDAAAALQDPRRLLAELELHARQVERAHDRLTHLQTITSALSEALTLEDIGRVVVSDMVRAVGAEQAVLAVPQGQRSLRLLAEVGFPPEAPFRHGSFPIDAELPMAESYRLGTPVFVGSAEELKRRYPDLLPLAAAALGCYPVTVSGRRLGVVGFGFVAERGPTAVDRALVQDLARQIGLALERARLYDEARRSEARLHEANRRKDEFLALLGHELRNPLAPIMTALQLMKLRGDSSSQWERAMIERQVMHVSRLVDDLLDVSRITQGKLELKKAPVDVSAVLAQAVEMASPLIEERAHRLVVEKPREAVWIEADPTRLAQALANLLTNAAKYTDAGGRITVRVSRDDEDAIVAVKDTGVGLRPEALATIFEPFVQVERTVERAQGGLGLGLALVRSLVELHGGTVLALSEGMGRGSEFRVRVPALPAAPRSLAPLPAAARHRVDAAGARRVLVVDDNPDSADALAEMLGVLGHDAQVAYDSASALEKAARFDLDVAVLDINLPVMDGYELARRLGRQAGGDHIRFVAVTGFGTEEDQQRSRRAGFAAHLVKPIDFDQLLRILAAARP